MENSREKNGIKVGTTAIIWGFATGMMAICIPLVSITHSNILLPLTVILGATISTIVVWRNSREKVIESLDNFSQIEQRVKDLETICSSKNFEANNKSQDLKKQ